MAGELYTWGWGKDGQLGHGDRISQKTPVRVEYFEGQGLGEISCGGWHTSALAGDTCPPLPHPGLAPAAWSCRVAVAVVSPR
jgi:hypothetical protein